MFDKIKKTILSLKETNISEDRKETLQQLTGFIQSKIDSNQAVNLNFICTHNSRRSHLSQVWAQAMAAFYNIPNVFSYSGGTEATALFPVAAKTLETNGFVIETIADSINPIYVIKLGLNNAPIIGFSKTFDNSFNPQSNFAAILTCSSADKGCPFIAGAEKRIPLTFEDPKAFDNTPQQQEKYLERSLQIATELKYVFSKLRN